MKWLLTEKFYQMKFVSLGEKNHYYNQLACGLNDERQKLRYKLLI